MTDNKKTLIKICGLTTPEDIRYVNEAQVDFAGFVLFFEKSKRNNPIENAEKLRKLLDNSIKSTAVVVSPDIWQIKKIEAAGFDYIQIHGKLTEELLSQIHLPVLKAFNVNDMDQYDFYHNSPQISGYVFDASEPGSGTTFDWNLVKKVPRDEKLLLLAGGLHAGNVADAILKIHPDGVDVSSSVEYENRPGKDPDKILRFTKTVRCCTG